MQIQKKLVDVASEGKKDIVLILMNELIRNEEIQ